MNKLDMESKNAVKDNLEYIREKFPNVVVESSNGYEIDFDLLKQELSSVIVDEKKEKYQLTWPGKKEAILNANTPSQNTLRPVKNKSLNYENTKNIYIEGDNLEVLKILQESYLSKIKCIFIDPPYNTGNDFIYKDNFYKNNNEELVQSGQIDDIGNRLITNSQSNGKFHSDWLSMLYSRLKLARNLLTDDGVIFITIDDKEQANLKKIADEIFGENNFVSNMIWQSRSSISNDYEVSLNHNHILIYSKNREYLNFGGELIDISEYKNPDNDVRGPWKLVPIDANHAGGNTVYPIVNPKTGIEYLPPNGRIWCYNKDTMQQLIDDGRIKFGINDDSAPKRKLFYNERIEKGDKKTPSSIILDAGTTKSGTLEIIELFEGKKVFDYPKPVSLIKKLALYGLYDGNGIILDFFSGSGTTAHAIMELNSEDNGKRKYIMVQMNENCDEKSEAFKNGYNDICEIGEERIRRAGKKIKEETNADIDYGFRVYKVDSSNMKDIYYKPSDVEQSNLFDMMNNIKEDRTSEDLLIQVMLDLGLTLDLKIEEKSILSNTVYYIADNSLVACFDDQVDINIIDEICKCSPMKVVFKDASFKTDKDKINLEERIKKISPETDVNII